MNNSKTFMRLESEMNQRVEDEIANMAEYYGISKYSSKYNEVRDLYNKNATCIKYDNVQESHKWKLIESTRMVNVYRCLKCGIIRKINKF